MLSFSAGLDDDEESALAERAEATLRSHYATHSSNGRATPLAPAAAPPKKRGRPLGSKNKPKIVPAAPAVGSAAASLSSAGSVGGSAVGSKRPSDSAGSASSAKRRAAPPPSHSFFLAPPSRIAQKGAYRAEASPPSGPGDPIALALDVLGVPAAEHAAVRDALAAGAAVAEPAAEASDSASFSRRFAVPQEEMYAADACPICEETMTFAYHDARKSIGAGVGAPPAMNRLVSHQQRQKERLLRAIQARANLSDHDQKCHIVLYEIERAMRGNWADERIFRLLIMLRREWIEKKLEWFEIAYVPWTLAQLRTHFDPANQHFKDDIRRVQYEYNQTADLQTVMYRAAHTAGAIDFRAADAFLKYAKQNQAYREEMRRLLEENQPDLAEAMRVLATAIARTTRDEGVLLLMQDPRTAAGTKPQGGDHRQTAGAVTVEEPHGQYEQSFLSGY